jgi:hypothetical protein
MEVTKWPSEDYAWLLHRVLAAACPRKRTQHAKTTLVTGSEAAQVSRARPFASAGPTSCSIVCAAAEVEKERSAMENDFGVKSVDSPRPNAAAWRRKRNSARPRPEKRGINVGQAS